MLIGLDMDGVETEWDLWLDSQLDLDPTLATFPRQPERGWNTFADCDPAHKTAVYKILEHPDYYASLEPVPGAIEAAKKMRADGHDVLFISSPWESNPMGYQAKADWLNRHIGGWARKNLILTSDKTLVRADVLVDDKPVMKGRFIDSPPWTRIFFTHTYNEGLPGPRIDNWTDGSWEDVLYGFADRLSGVR